MARHGQRFDSVNISGAVQAHLGDTVTNHYHTTVQSQDNLFEALLRSLTFDGMGARVRNVAAAPPRTYARTSWFSVAQGQTGVRQVDYHERDRRLGRTSVVGPDPALVLLQRPLAVCAGKVEPRPIPIAGWQLQAAVPICHSLFLEHFASKGREKKGVGTGQKTIEVEKWTEIELQNVLIAVVRKLPLPPITMFIDALDEGADDDVRRMVRFLERMTQYAIATATVHRLRICLSSRHYPHISVARSLSVVVEDQAQHSQHVEFYIRSELVGRNIRGIDDLRLKVRERSQRILLWVVLVVPILNEAYDQGRSVSIMLRRLNEIPQELSDLFTQIFTRNTNDFEKCINLLQWVMFAKRSLSPMELYYAVNQVYPQIDDEEPVTATYDEVTRYLRNLSRGLVELTKTRTTNPTVQFVHETVRDNLTSEHLLERGGSQGPAPGISTQDFQAGICHEKLAQVCLLYLLNNYQETPWIWKGGHPRPLARYAAEYWWQHLQSSPSPCSVRVVQQALKLLTGSTDSLFFWVWLYNIGSTPRWSDPTMYHVAPPVYYAACIGRPELVSGVLALGADVNARRDEHCEIALYVESARGDEEMVRIIVDAGADPNARGGYYFDTALYTALEGDHVKVVQILSKCTVGFR